MKLKKGDRFTDYMGNLCFISYIYKDVVKLTFIAEKPYVEVWDKKEFIDEVSICKFVPQPKIVINRTNIAEHLIEYQLNMVGTTIKQAEKDENWYNNITMTSVQHQVFKSYAIPLIRKIFKCNKQRAETTFAWFDLSHGLRIKD